MSVAILLRKSRVYNQEWKKGSRKPFGKDRSTRSRAILPGKRRHGFISVRFLMAKQYAFRPVINVKPTLTDDHFDRTMDVGT
ncbi:MAG: hypothetical protein A2Z06_04545 [Candidatus Glassbacteria bacterium RBG_16_58_8]|uniref:Uncharacterized protein n=1 Tax=Candidatus Glassbacteria bacterium RBG_16_58_8 TaxID=1817866 RepID=A0A1F5YCX4_9BACT|nr:MAG: hypothetical protein A2Z06_04545 [Candidatus Glassbacteria bacterium RBG_16_58_8]